MAVVISKRSFRNDNRHRSVADTLEKAATLLAVVAPFVYTTFALIRAGIDHDLYWWDPLLLVFFYLLIAPGVTVGLHRLFVHQSFEVTTAGKIFLGILAEMAIEGTITTWSANHKEHHATSDGPLDLHRPMKSLLGFLWAHIGWLFSAYKANPKRYVRYLLDDPIIRLLDRLFFFWVFVSLALPTLLGGVIGVLCGVPFVDAAWHGFIWGGLVRVFFVHHVTWSVNSVCHRFGAREFTSKPDTDQSRNNVFVGLLGLGEGWHGNHHAFQWSAVHGIGRHWIFDLSYSVWIKGLIRIGWAKNPKIPTVEQLERKRIKPAQVLQRAA